MSSLCVESSRIENHCDRLVELKRLVIQLDDYRFETLKYLCAHFRRVASKCDVNKVRDSISLVKHKQNELLFRSIQEIWRLSSDQH